MTERRKAPEGIDPENPATWPEGKAVRWERITIDQITDPVMREFAVHALDEFHEGFSEVIAESPLLDMVHAVAVAVEPPVNPSGQVPDDADDPPE